MDAGSGTGERGMELLAERILKVNTPAASAAKTPVPTKTTFRFEPPPGSRMTYVGRRTVESWASCASDSFGTEGSRRALREVEARDLDWVAVAGQRGWACASPRMSPASSFAAFRFANALLNASLGGMRC